MTDTYDFLKCGFAGHSILIPTIECILPNEQDASILQEFGLPAEFAGWFRAVPIVKVIDLSTVVSYDTGSGIRNIKCGAVISVVRMFRTIVDTETGHVLYINGTRSGLINSSVVSMLLCMAHFLESTRVGYSDVAARLNVCKAFDEMAFADPEGIWSELFDEAADGMY